VTGYRCRGVNPDDGYSLTSGKRTSA
jgi:hypothetical protein